LRAGLSALVAVCAVFLAGCSGEEDRLTKSQYEQKVRSVYSGVQTAFESTRDAGGSQLAGRIDQARQELITAAKELESAEPPREIEEENEELVEGMREYAESLEEIRAAAERNDEDTIGRFNLGLGGNAAVERMAEAAEEMKFKGYDLGRIAEE
jgi:FMN phosphatase YigB (HAD superfamily)